MDLVQAGVVFALGLACGVVVAVIRGRSRHESEPAGSDHDRRVRRIDATEAYLTNSIVWLFNRAMGNREVLPESDGQIVGVPYGQIDLRLLSPENALEYAALCRWLWGQGPSLINSNEALSREQAFRRRLHATLEHQRELADAGEPPDLLRPDAAAIVNEVVDEVRQYRAEQSAAPATR